MCLRVVPCAETHEVADIVTADARVYEWAVVVEAMYAPTIRQTNGLRNPLTIVCVRALGKGQPVPRQKQHVGVLS